MLSACQLPHTGSNHSEVCPKKQALPKTWKLYWQNPWKIPQKRYLFSKDASTSPITLLNREMNFPIVISQGLY